MGVDAVDRLPAGIEPRAVLLDRRLQRRLIAYRLKKHRAQRLHIGGQGVKSACMRAGPVHAQAQFRRKAGGADLRSAVSQGIHQAVMPAPPVACRVGRQQRRELRDVRFFKRTHPLRIKACRHHQRKQLRRVLRFGRAGQQLAAQPLRQFADKSGARRKTKVSQQRGDIDRLDQCFPPGLQPGLQLRLLLDCFNKRLHPGDGRLSRGFVAANPFKKLDQPDMAIGQLGCRVQRLEQPGQILHRRPECRVISAARAGRCRRYSSLPG